MTQWIYHKVLHTWAAMGLELAVLPASPAWRRRRRASATVTSVSSQPEGRAAWTRAEKALESRV